MEIDLDKLEKAALAATPGPWKLGQSNVLSNVPATDEYGQTIGRRFPLRCTTTWYPDAKFIAMANPRGGSRID